MASNLPKQLDVIQEKGGPLTARASIGPAQMQMFSVSLKDKDPASVTSSTLHGRSSFAKNGGVSKIPSD